MKIFIKENELLNKLATSFVNVILFINYRHYCEAYNSFIPKIAIRGKKTL